MCIILKSPCCNTSTPGVNDPFTFLAFQHFDEVDRGWDGCVVSAVRSIFGTHLRKTPEMQSSSGPPAGRYLVSKAFCWLWVQGNYLCSPGFPPARILAVSGEQA